MARRNPGPPASFGEAERILKAAALVDLCFSERSTRRFYVAVYIHLSAS